MTALIRIPWGRSCLGRGPQPRQQYLSPMHVHFQRHMNRRMLRPVRLVEAVTRAGTPRADGAPTLIVMAEVEFEPGPTFEMFAHWWVKNGTRFTFEEEAAPAHANAEALPA